jgi:hypothetical protein
VNDRAPPPGMARAAFRRPRNAFRGGSPPRYLECEGLLRQSSSAAVGRWSGTIATESIRIGWNAPVSHFSVSN